VERAEILREKGTNRSRFFRGQVDKYTWVDVGSSYLPSDMLAAYLCAQLECWQSIQDKRKHIWERYAVGLKDWATCCNGQLPTVPEHCEQSHHMFYMLLPSMGVRQALIEHLKRKGILSVFHYMPLHASEMGLRFGGYVGQCPVSESVSDRLIRLPYYNDLSESEQDEVIESVCAFRLAAAAA
jgi:dTDP-4-amino-4,6-dideoxygalactose transaminase